MKVHDFLKLTLAASIALSATTPLATPAYAGHLSPTPKPSKVVRGKSKGKVKSGTSATPVPTADAIVMINSFCDGPEQTVCASYRPQKKAADAKALAVTKKEIVKAASKADQPYADYVRSVYAETAKQFTVPKDLDKKIRDFLTSAVLSDGSLESAEKEKLTKGIDETKIASSFEEIEKVATANDLKLGFGVGCGANGMHAGVAFFPKKKAFVVCPGLIAKLGQAAAGGAISLAQFAAILPVKIAETLSAPDGNPLLACLYGHAAASEDADSDFATFARAVRNVPEAYLGLGAIASAMDMEKVPSEKRTEFLREALGGYCGQKPGDSQAGIFAALGQTVSLNKAMKCGDATTEKPACGYKGEIK